MAPTDMPACLTLTDIQERGIEQHECFDWLTTQVEDLLSEGLRKGMSNPELLALVKSLSTLPSLHENTTSQLHAMAVLLAPAAATKSDISDVLNTCRVRTDGAFFHLRYQSKGTELKKVASAHAGAQIAGCLAVTKIQKLATNVETLSFDDSKSWYAPCREYKEILTSTSDNSTFQAKHADTLAMIQGRFDDLRVALVRESTCRVERDVEASLRTATLDDSRAATICDAVNGRIEEFRTVAANCLPNADSLENIADAMRRYSSLIGFIRHSSDTSKLLTVDGVLTGVTLYTSVYAMSLTSTVLLDHRTAAARPYTSNGSVLQYRLKELKATAVTLTSLQSMKLIHTSPDAAIREGVPWNENLNMVATLMAGVDVPTELTSLRTHGATIARLCDAWHIPGSTGVPELVDALGACSMHPVFPAAASHLHRFVAVAADLSHLGTLPPFTIDVPATQASCVPCCTKLCGKLDAYLGTMRVARRSMDAFRTALAGGHNFAELVSHAPHDDSVARDLFISWETLEKWLNKINSLAYSSMQHIQMSTMSKIEQLVGAIESCTTHAVRFQYMKKVAADDEIRAWLDDDTGTFLAHHLTYAVQVWYYRCSRYSCSPN